MNSRLTPSKSMITSRPIHFPMSRKPTCLVAPKSFYCSHLLYPSNLRTDYSFTHFIDTTVSESKVDPMIENIHREPNPRIDEQHTSQIFPAPPPLLYQLIPNPLLPVPLFQSSIPLLHHISTDSLTPQLLKRVTQCRNPTQARKIVAP